MITVISLTHKAEELEKRISNWSEVPEQVKAHLLEADEIGYSFSEMLFYKNHTIIASCTINGDIVELEDCWTKQGNIWE